MFNILFAADFPIAKSGIASTASSILAEEVLNPVRLFSEQLLTINGVPTRKIKELGDECVDLIFSHTECAVLPELQQRFPNAIYHVGDWPLRHWDSVRRVQPFKGALANLRCHWRLRRLDRKIKLAFVTQEDCISAIDYGFSQSLHLPIGVKSPKVPLADHVDVQSVCFSGNFRYPPNRDAAKRLLKLARSQFPDKRVILVGFYADDFKEQLGDNVEIYPDVPSVVDFLAVRRPIYISLIDTGAGAKNKILEAMVAGCPIICTPESLDVSIPTFPSIKIVSFDKEVASLLIEWNLPSNRSFLVSETSKLANDTRARRSWNSVAGLTRDSILNCPRYTTS